MFVNPLARALFRFSFEGRESVTVRDMQEDPDGIVTVHLE